MMGQLWLERLESGLDGDGFICEDPRGATSRQSRLNVIGDTSQVAVRLRSFENSPYATRRNLSQILARAGFYYIGISNIVKCYKCGQCVRNFVSEDDPRDWQWHFSGCSTRGNDRFTDILAQSSSSSAFQNLTLTERQVHDRNYDTQAREGPHQPSSEVRGAERMDMSQVHETTTIAQATDDREVYEAFACLDPVTPGMINQSDRASTFRNFGWDENAVRSTPQEIALAGFFYTGESDRTKCWYCGGCLENWDYYDDPWHEHAKWFPNCEHVLRHKGPDFVHDIVSRFPNLSQPENEPRPISPIRPQPPAPAHPVTPAAPRLPSLPIPPQAPRLPRPPAPPIPPSHASQNTIHLPSGVSLSLIGGTMGAQGQPVIQTNTGGGGHTFTVRTSRGTVITYNYGGYGTGNTHVQLSGSRRNRQPPQFVDPRQEEQQHLAEVNDELENSPLVTAVKNMGFAEETIRMVLLSKFLADGQMFQSVDDLVETLTQYQQELTRIESSQSAAGATGSSSASNQEEAEPSTPERELRRLEESRNCKLCHRETATVVLMPCAHLAVCVNCSNGIRVCPVCRRMVTEAIRSFIS